MKELWPLVFSVFGVHWILLLKLIDLFLSLKGKFGRHSSSINVLYRMLYCSVYYGLFGEGGGIRFSMG
jgi:hypothetical protein